LCGHIGGSTTKRSSSTRTEKVVPKWVDKSGYPSQQKRRELRGLKVTTVEEGGENLGYEKNWAIVIGEKG